MDLFTEPLLNSLFSLGRVLMGVALAFFVGTSLGILRSLLPSVLKRNFVINFLFDAGKYPPPIAWIPFVILLFGIGNFAASVIVFIGAFSPIFTNTYEGVEQIPVILINTLKTFEVSFWKRLKALFMSALPQIYSGLKIGVSMGWMSVIAAEMISGQSGLGYSIQVNRLNMQYESMAIDMCFIGGIGFLLNYSINFFEKRILSWHEST
jgi:ABC-type nitrate/sulfonate/bicarbonate transport system permease component